MEKENWEERAEQAIATHCDNHDDCHDCVVVWTHTLKFIRNDRAALHKEILAKAPNNPFGDDAFLAQTGFDTCLSQYRKAIDEVFSSKKTL